MSRRFGSIVSLCLLCLLGACANHTWAPGPGKSASELARDSARCHIFARGANPGFSYEASGSPQFVAGATAGAAIGYGIATAITTNENFNDCMQTNGWLIADDAPPAPAPMFDEGSVDGRVGVSAQPLAASLVNAPAAPRRALGIRVITVPAELSGWLHMDSPNGLLVLGVIPGGVAAVAGVRTDDVLLTLADAPVSTAEDVNAALAAVHGQDVVDAQIWRHGQMQSVRLTF
jgi:hypothetical protein